MLLKNEKRHGALLFLTYDQVLIKVFALFHSPSLARTRRFQGMERKIRRSGEKGIAKRGMPGKTCAAQVMGRTGDEDRNPGEDTHMAVVQRMRGHQTKCARCQRETWTEGMPHARLHRCLLIRFGGNRSEYKSNPAGDCESPGRRGADEESDVRNLRLLVSFLPPIYFTCVLMIMTEDRRFIM